MQYTDDPVVKREITLVLDPRFPGGTSSAVAREIHALSSIARVRIVALYTEMFKGTQNNPLLDEAFAAFGITPELDPPLVNSDTIVVHNPSFLKFNKTLETRFVCNRMVIVSHENFLRPNGKEGFDVEKCLSLLARQTLAKEFLIAPVSGYNRYTVNNWLVDKDVPWKLTNFDWFNICDFDFVEPVAHPRDRRGRHSRAGFEKFPSNAVMEVLFPDTAEYCGILGADTHISSGEVPTHWDLYKFREIPVETFLENLDFFVYFTHPQLQESFGRVIAEAIAAGKLVITDPLTARTFGDAVVSTIPDNVGSIIRDFISSPTSYRNQVLKAQNSLQQFSSRNFAAIASAFLDQPQEALLDFM